MKTAAKRRPASRAATVAALSPLVCPAHARRPARPERLLSVTPAP